MTGGSVFGARRLVFISTGEAQFEETCASGMDVLHQPGEAGACIDAIRHLLTGSVMLSWDHLELKGVPEDSPLLDLPDERGRERWGVTRVIEGECPTADMSEGFDSYLNGLSSSTKRESRRLLKSADVSGARLEVADDAASVDLFFDQLVVLHQRRWEAEGKPGCFTAPRFSAFHHTLARLLVPQGDAVLARLVLDGETLAVAYGYMARSKFDLYLTGVTPEESDAVRSPGTAIHLLTMAHLASRGIRQFDFLLATGPSYKQRFGSGGQRLARLLVVRPTARAALHSALNLARRGTHKVLRRIPVFKSHKSSPVLSTGDPAG
jgi:hypothetical protein